MRMNSQSIFNRLNKYKVEPNKSHICFNINHDEERSRNANKNLDKDMEKLYLARCRFFHLINLLFIFESFK